MSDKLLSNLSLKQLRLLSIAIDGSYFSSPYVNKEIADTYKDIKQDMDSCIEEKKKQEPDGFWTLAGTWRLK